MWDCCPFGPDAEGPPRQLLEVEADRPAKARPAKASGPLHIMEVVAVEAS